MNVFSFDSSPDKFLCILHLSVSCDSKWDFTPLLEYCAVRWVFSQQNVRFMVIFVGALVDKTEMDAAAYVSSLNYH